MTSHARSTAGDATAAFVLWLVTGAVGPALVALPMNLVADKLAGAAMRWFKRFRQTDDLSRLVKAAGTSVQLGRDEIKELRDLLTQERTWSLLAGGRLDENLEHLTEKIASCLPASDGRMAEDARRAAGAIARGLLEFAVYDLQPEIFQKVVLARLQQMADEFSALDEALFRLHKDLYHHVGEAKDLLWVVLDRLPPGPADLNEIKIYLKALIDWLNTDPWPRDLQLGGPVLTPAAIERKLWVRATDPGLMEDAEADELARQCHRLVILGGPGSGKTWLAMRTARICAEEALKRLENDATLDEVELPLYTTCSRLVSTPGQIREAVVSSALNWIGDLGGSRIVNALRLSLTERDAPTLLVIDSLDEASDPKLARDRLRQADSLKPPWRVVLTSRPSSWNNQITIEKANQGHRVGELQSLHYPNDVVPVIEQWFAADPERGQVLAAQIAGRPNLEQAVTVPLILAFYCILSGSQLLPEFRHELYKQVINRMLYGPWRPGGGPPHDPVACRATLRTWAWRGAKNHPVSGVGQWEDDIATTQAQLSPVDQVAVDHIAAPQGGRDFDSDETSRRFTHRSIREHLVAEYVASLQADRAAQELLPHLWYDPDWEYTAPAAIAMHPERDRVLRSLLCRVCMSGQIPGDLSVLDAGGEVRRLLARIAAESKEEAWSCEMATIIGQARVELASSDRLDDIDAAVDWPTSNRQARGVLLRRLTCDPHSWETHRLTGTLARLGPTETDRRQARKVLLEQLARNPHSLEIGLLARTLAQLATTAEDKRQAREVLLQWLPPPLPTGRLAQLAATADDKRQAREILLEQLARETNSWRARGLAHTLAQFGPTPDDKRQARKALLEQLAHETSSSMAAELAEMLARLDMTPDEQRQARQVLIRQLAHEAMSFLADKLVRALAQLGPTQDDKHQAREILLERLAREPHSWETGRLAHALIQLATTADDKRQALRILLQWLASGPRVWEIGLLKGTLAQLATTADENRQAREILLERLAHNNSSRVSAELADGLVQLRSTADDKQQARKVLLERLASDPDIEAVVEVVQTMVQLGPTVDEKRQAREILLEQLAHEPDFEAAVELVRSMAQLDPTVGDLSIWPAWAAPPSDELLAAVRRNSALDRWLAVLPSLSPLSLDP